MAVDSSIATETAERATVDDRRWHRIRVRIAVGYFVLLAAFIATVGVPSDREALLLFTLAGLGIRCVGRGWRSFRRVLLDWLPFTAMLIAYDYTRGFADHLGINTHLRAPADADEWLFGGTLPTAWLQQHLFSPGTTHWYDAVATLVYTSHFLATPVVAVVLWLRNRPAWLDFIVRVMALSLLGLLTYVIYPAAPPWLAARDGAIAPVVRLSSRGWLELHLSRAGNMLAGAQAGVNEVAAMPSMHTAVATVIALFLFGRSPWWGKVLCVLYPIAMGLALVYTGEHYVIDVLVGYAYGALLMALMPATQRSWRRWRAGRTLPLSRADSACRAAQDCADC